MHKTIFYLVFFILVLVCLLQGQTKNKHSNIKQISFLDKIIDQPNYQQWVAFWKDSFPDTDLKNLKFKTKKSLKFQQLHPLSTEKIKELKTRDFTLNHSPQQNYLIDLYTDVIFEKIPKKNNWNILGRGADPAFAFYSLKDSLFFTYTSGTTTFYEESMWLSDTMFVILGISYWPVPPDSYQKFLLISGEIRNNSVDLTIYISKKMFPWKSDWKIYMQHKHPNLIFTF